MSLFLLQSHNISLAATTIVYVEKLALGKYLTVVCTLSVLHILKSESLCPIWLLRLPSLLHMLLCYLLHSSQLLCFLCMHCFVELVSFSTAHADQTHETWRRLISLLYFPLHSSSCCIKSPSACRNSWKQGWATMVWTDSFLQTIRKCSLDHRVGTSALYHQLFI